MARTGVKLIGLLLGPLAVFLCLPAAQPTRAQEAGASVQFRTDYNTALQEAKQKNRPLVIDFGTEHCYWCKQLDLRTFSDPGVAKMMNENFIPLRIDAEREATLAQYLRIQNYPTVVIAGPDGKILGTQEGFVEAPRFRDQLERALAAVSNPEWMTRDYEEANKASKASDYSRAIALLRSVIEDGKDRPVQVKARQVLKLIEEQAAGQLEKARQYSDKGQTNDAMSTLTELVSVYSGTSAAVEARQMLTSLGSRQEMKSQQRVRRARELLAQAREDYRTQQYLCCMDRCEVLASSYADLQEGEEARLLISEIKSNPAWMQTACENLSDRLSTLYLSLAETLLKKGQPQQATAYLERIVKAFPNTRQADVAQLRLTQIQGLSPTQQTSLKKQ